MPLSKKQKSTLCSMAAQAYRKTGAAAGFQNVDAYRRAICVDVVGKDGLTQCSNSDFVPLFNTFAAIIGSRPKAAEDGFTHLLWRIRDALRKFELRETYAQAIAADRLHVSPNTPLETMLRMMGLDAAEQILYTINTRGRARVRKENARLGLPPDACPEPHVSRSTMAPGTLPEHLNQVYCPPPPAHEDAHRRPLLKSPS